MIFDIDHIGWTSHNFEKDSELLLSLGYTNQFSELNKPNLSIKKTMLRNYSQTQDLSLYYKNGSLGIELLRHSDEPSMQMGFIKPVFELGPGKEAIEFSESDYLQVSWSGHSIEVLSTLALPKPDLNLKKLMVTTNDTIKAAQFWKQFGFKEVHTEEGFSILNFKSILKNEEYQLCLKLGEKSPNTFLDDQGFSNIAFVSNSVQKECRKIEKKGYEITEIEQIEVNNKLLDICFVKGNGGELVEIISAVK